MITLSEALSNFSGTTNYVSKYTPTGNVLGISQIFDNGTNIGIGTATPTAKLQIIGSDSTSSNYSLKIDNSASSPLLYVRNDGNIDLGDVNSYGGTSLSYIKNSGFNGAFYINGNAGNGLNNGKQVYINSEFVRLGTQSQSVFGQGATYIEMQVFDGSSNLKINKSTYDSYSPYTSLGVSYKEGSGAVISATVSSFIYNRILNFNDINNRTLNGININTSLGSWNNTGVGKSTNIGLNVLVGNADINYAAILNGGNVGIGTTTPTAKLQIIGTDSTSSNYSLKIDNSASSPLLYVRNDGEISMNGFTIRQLSNYTVFKTSGNNGYLFNNSTDSINLARLTNVGVLILNAVATLNANVGLSVKSQGTSNLTKEFIAELYKGTTNNTGIAIASKEGVSYIQGYTTSNTQTVDLILGGYNGAGSLLDNIILKSDGNVGINTITPSEKLEINGNIKTAQPSANGAGAWKLGKKVTATVSLITTDYIEVEIDSVVYKLALVS